MFIATSASFSNAEAAKDFVSGLCGLDATAIQPLTGKKHAVKGGGPGDPGLAARLAAVPLEALQSTTLAERSAVLPPLVRSRIDIAGKRVSLKRIDSGQDAIVVSVGGFDCQGDRINETVLVKPRGEAKTKAPLLIVDTVSCPEGSVSVARSYPLGRATEQGFEIDKDDLPAALAEVLGNQPVVRRLRNITSGAKAEDDPVADRGSAWALTALPGILFAGAADGVAATDVLLELASLAKAAPDKPPLLPARVHMLFRGLPGLSGLFNAFY